MPSIKQLHILPPSKKFRVTLPCPLATYYIKITFALSFYNSDRPLGKINLHKLLRIEQTPTSWSTSNRSSRREVIVSRLRIGHTRITYSPLINSNNYTISSILPALPWRKLYSWTHLIMPQHRFPPPFLKQSKIIFSQFIFSKNILRSIYSGTYHYMNSLFEIHRLYCQLFKRPAYVL